MDRENKELVKLANSLLDKLPGNRKIARFEDIKAGLFVTLYEGLFAEPLPDAITPSRSKEDDIHNVQAVIDTISLEKLNVSMSHICGDAVVYGDPQAIHYLLEVFEGLYEYVLEKISSEASSTIGDDEVRQLDIDDDPDVVTPQLIDDILAKELEKSSFERCHKNSNNNGTSKGSQNEKSLEDTDDLIALGQISSIRETSAMSRDRTSELIALGDSRYDHYIPKQGQRDVLSASKTDKRETAQTGAGYTNKDEKSLTKDLLVPTADTTGGSVVYPENPAGNTNNNTSNPLFDFIGASQSRSLSHLAAAPGPVDASGGKEYSISHQVQVYHHYDQNNGKMLSKSLPGRLTSSHHETQTTPTLELSGKQDKAVSPMKAPVRQRMETVHIQTSPERFDRLHNLVEDTISMSRAALDSSPSRKYQPRQTEPQSILSPGKNGSAPEKSHRKVSFLTGRLSDDLPNSTPDTSGDYFHSDIAKQQALSLLQSHAERKKSSLGKGPSRTQLATARPPSRKSPSKDLHGNMVNGRKGVLKHGSKDRLVMPRRSVSNTTEDEYHSDSCIDYGNESDDSTSFEKELMRYKQQLQKRAKQVRFDDILDDSAPGHMGSIRRKLLKEDKNARFKTEILRDQYDEEVVDYETALMEELEKLAQQAKIQDKEYKQKVLRKPKTNSYKPQAKKYSTNSANTGVLYPRRGRSKNPIRKRSASVSPNFSRNSRHGGADEILPWLLEEFPYLHMSSETLHDMWRRSARQIEHLSKTEAEVKSKKTKTIKQIEESELKHKVLVNIMKKELSHQQKMREKQEKLHQEQAVKAAIRDKRIASARARRYYEEYQIRMRSRKLKKRTKEEQVFKKLFNEGLDIQKERIRELRKYAKEQRDLRAKKNQDQVQSIENYYRDQFQMLSELLEKEKKERQLRDKAQSKVVGELQRDLRRKLEHEVQEIQEQIIRDDDDAYFREIDAQRLRTRLNLARYQAAV